MLQKRLTTTTWLNANAAHDMGFCDRVLYTADTNTKENMLYDKKAMVTNTIAAMRKKLSPIKPKQVGEDVAQFEKRLNLLK